MPPLKNRNNQVSFNASILSMFAGLLLSKFSWGPGVGSRNDRGGGGNFQCRFLGGLVQKLEGFNPQPSGNYNPACLVAAT
jgi:hypothetical protein